MSPDAPADPSDEALMAAHIAGDPKAMRELFRRHAPRLARVLRVHFSNEADAQDVVQAAFLNLHRARRDYRPGARLQPWLFTIAYNLMRDHHRYRARRPEDLREPGHADASEVSLDRSADPDHNLRGEPVRRALRALPPAQREVIVLHWFEGFSFAEIAQIVGAGHSAVKVRAHRGYKRLRELLEAEGVTALDAGT